MRSLNLRLSPKGLRVLPLRFSGGRMLLYVYRPDGLRNDLAAEEARRILAEQGYVECEPERCLSELRRRLASSADFPHEIGLFLSYPPEDVRGFMSNSECKHVGCWKVYGDAEKAKKLFARYKKCTDLYALQFAGGKSIEQLTVKRTAPRS